MILLIYHVCEKGHAHVPQDVEVVEVPAERRWSSPVGIAGHDPGAQCLVVVGGARHADVELAYDPRLNTIGVAFADKSLALTTTCQGARVVGFPHTNLRFGAIVIVAAPGTTPSLATRPTYEAQYGEEKRWKAMADFRSSGKGHESNRLLALKAYHARDLRLDVSNQVVGEGS